MPRIPKMPHQPHSNLFGATGAQIEEEYGNRLWLHSCALWPITSSSGKAYKPNISMARNFHAH